MLEAFALAVAASNVTPLSYAYCNAVSVAGSLVIAAPKLMLAMSAPDSVWHKQLSHQAEGGSGKEKSPYWLTPFRNSKEYCPYLVGSYERVAAELAKFIEASHSTYILDIPPSDEESRHINRGCRWNGSPRWSLPSAKCTAGEFI